MAVWQLLLLVVLLTATVVTVVTGFGRIAGSRVAEAEGRAVAAEDRAAAAEERARAAELRAERAEARAGRDAVVFGDPARLTPDADVRMVRVDVRATRRDGLSVEVTWTGPVTPEDPVREPVRRLRVFAAGGPGDRDLPTVTAAWTVPDPVRHGLDDLGDILYALLAAAPTADVGGDAGLPAGTTGGVEALADRLARGPGAVRFAGVLAGGTLVLSCLPGPADDEVTILVTRALAARTGQAPWADW